MSTADRGYLLKIGAIDVVALSDGRVPLPTQRLFPETPEEVWTPYRSRFPEAFDANGRGSLSLSFSIPGVARRLSATTCRWRTLARWT